MPVMAQRPAPALMVTDGDAARLRAAIRASTSEQRAVTRARIILRSAEGGSIEGIAAELGVAVMTVKLWRRRYARLGVDGLRDAPRPGHPPTWTREDRDRVQALAMGPPPDGTTHWSVRDLAKRTGMSPSTITGSGANGVSSLTGPRPSSSAPTRPSRPRSGTSSASTSTRPMAPSC